MTYKLVDGHKKRFNYNIEKNKLSIDKTKLNFDYIAGVVFANGSIDYKKRRLVICSRNITFLKAIQEFFEINHNIKSTLYEKGGWLCIYNGAMIRRFMDYSFDKSREKICYIAGIFDCDGSFSPHKSKTNEYWRFQICSKKIEKYKIYKRCLEYLDIFYREEKRKDNILSAYVTRADEVFSLIMKLEKYMILKNDIIDVIFYHIMKHDFEKYDTCRYCKQIFNYTFAKRKEGFQSHVCFDEKCRRRLYAEKARISRKRNGGQNGEKTNGNKQGLYMQDLQL